MTELLLSQFQTAVAMQTEARKTMRENNTPERIVDMITEELGELKEGMESCRQAAISQESQRLKELLVGSEIADLLFLSLYLADLYGIDASAALEKKMKRNLLKYPFEMFNDGIPYEEAHAMCKEVWSQNGGDQAFYEKECPIDSPTKK